MSRPRKGATIPDSGTKQDHATEEFQSMMLSIVSDDSPIESQLGHILNLIYTQQRPELFVKYLDRYIGKKEREIEKICSDYSEEFIKSMYNLLDIQKMAATLKNRMSTTNDELQSAAKQMIASRTKSIKYNRLLLNLKTALNAFEACRSLFEQVDMIQSELNKIKTKNEQCNYRMVLKGLGAMQEYQQGGERSVLLRIHSWISYAHGMVEQAMLADIRDWLAAARQLSSRLGESIMNEIEDKFFNNDQKSDDGSISDGVEISSFLSMVKLDCETIFRTAHMFRVMKREKIFASYYAENRRLQAEIMLQGTGALLQKEFKYFYDYICEIIGFFIIEFFMMSSPYEFYPSSQVFVLWERAQDNLQSIFAGNEADQKNEDSEFSKNVINLMIKFLHSIEYFGFPASRLVEVLSVMFYKNMENIKVFIMENIHQRILEDACASLAVATSEEEFKKVTSKFYFLHSFPYNYGQADSITFPIKLPFTPLILKVYDELIALADAICDFSTTNRDLDMMEYASKSLDTCIIQHIAQVLVNLRISDQISYYVHVWLDLEALIHISNLLEEYLADKYISNPFKRLTYSSSQTNIRKISYLGPRLRCKQILPQLQFITEQKISSLIRGELNESITASLDQEFVGSIKDPMDLLASIWRVMFDPLPYIEKSRIMCQEINNLCSILLDGMMDQSTITDKVIQSFSEHVKLLQGLISDLGWKEDDKDLTEFRTLLQIVSLLKSKTPEKYLDASYRMKHYSSLSTGTVILVLEKMEPRYSGSEAIRELLEKIQVEEKIGYRGDQNTNQ